MWRTGSTEFLGCVSSSDSEAAIKFLSIEPLLEDIGELDLSGISWVIVGGESGPGARSMKKEWVISIRDQCLEKGVPFFFKQWGGTRKKNAGRMLEGNLYDEFPPILATHASEATRLARMSQQEAKVLRILG